MIAWFITLLCLASPGAETPVDRITLNDGTVVEGLLLSNDGTYAIIDFFEPYHDEAGIQRIATADIAEADRSGMNDNDWKKRYAWYVAACKQRDVAARAADTALLVEMLDEIDKTKWRAALVDFKKLQKGKPPAAIAAVDALVTAQTEQSLVDLLAEVQLRAAMKHSKGTSFKLKRRPSIEAAALSTRFEDIVSRLIETPVPTNGDEDYERLVFPIGGLATMPPTTPAAPVVNTDISREHSIRAWIDDPVNYDADREAANLMLRRIAFALGVTRAWRDVAEQVNDADLEERIQTLRGKLSALQEAVRNRSRGKLTPAEQQKMRQAQGNNGQQRSNGKGSGDDESRDRRGRDPSDRGRDPSDRGRDPR